MHSLSLWFRSCCILIVYLFISYAVNHNWSRQSAAKSALLSRSFECASAHSCSPVFLPSNNWCRCLCWPSSALACNEGGRALKCWALKSSGKWKTRGCCLLEPHAAVASVCVASDRCERIALLVPSEGDVFVGSGNKKGRRE